ncbi:LOW QUALITY PROTEIN: olfactory receptor 2Y1-like [Dugong dugon]
MAAVLNTGSLWHQSRERLNVTLQTDMDAVVLGDQPILTRTLANGWGLRSRTYPQRKASRNFNTSFREDFILVGFSDWPQLELALFVFISIFYSLTLFGNTTIITVSRLDHRLHTPRYFFLCHLSFLDLCYTTSTVPQLLINLHGSDQTITYGGCMAQLFIFLALGSTECVLLVVMAFDRYAAVCPLHYMAIMHPCLCQALAATSWVGGFMNSAVQAGLLMAMPLCGLHYLNHFFCEMPVLLKLACDDTQGTEVKMFVARVIILVVPAALILGSYVVIAQAVLRINSTDGRRKAFGTCGSHILVVSLFYGSGIYTYLQPIHSYSQSEGKFVALFYTIVTPMLNPLIYTLRNKDVKRALRKVLWKGRDLG